MDYQRKTVSTDASIGDPGPLPTDLVGLDDTSLADLDRWLDPGAAIQLGYAGQGFVPMLRKITAIAFKQRLTGGERIAIRTAGATDPIVADFLDLLATSTLVDLDHADTVNGLAYLVSESLLDADRPAEIRV